MNKLALVSIAAIAASLPALASAQQQTVSPPVPWEEVPAARLNVPAAPPPSAGVTWQQRAPRSQVPARLPDTATRAATHQNGGPVALVRQAKRGGHGGGMRHMRPGGGMKHMRPGGGGGMKHMRPGGGMHHARPGGMKHVRPGGGMHHVRPGGKHWTPGGKHWRPGGKHWRPGGHHAGGGHGKRFDHFRRIHRGGRVHNFWWGPQFHIQNWGLYGFPAPLHDDWRWVRYYDDAYLIDRDGRVHDGRYGLDWDRYGERWDYDERGIPTYGDYDDGAYGEDYAEEDYGDDGYAEDEERVYEDRREYGHGDGYGHGGYGKGGCTVTYSFDSRHPVPPPPPPPCASGYGYGHGGTVVVTETTVTTAPTVTEHVVYEDVVVREKVRKHKPKRKYHKRHVPPPPPPPYDGERG